MKSWFGMLPSKLALLSRLCSPPEFILDLFAFEGETTTEWFCASEYLTAKFLYLLAERREFERPLSTLVSPLLLLR